MKGGHKGLLKVVLDTNVLISALGFEGKETGRIWDLVEQEQVEVYLSDFILEELGRNLIKKVGFTMAETEELLDRIRESAQIIQPSMKISVVKRKDSDNRILECAVAAGAAVLVTGNMRDLKPLGSFQGIEILTPREFLLKYFS